jgi:hypothetical protein
MYDGHARSGSQGDSHTVSAKGDESQAGLRGHKRIDTSDDTRGGHDRNVSTVYGVKDSPTLSAYVSGYAIEIRLHAHHVVTHMTREVEAVERRCAYPSRTTGGHPYCRVATG